MRRKRSRRSYYTQTFENGFKVDATLFDEVLPKDKLSEASDDLDETERMLCKRVNATQPLPQQS